MLAAAGTLALVAGCGTPKPDTAQVAQLRADTYASVAQRIYRQEVEGAANSAAFARISRLPALLSSLARGDEAGAARALKHQSVRHAVRVRVVRGARVLVDVGLPFVIAGRPRPLLSQGGSLLGQVEISIQDVTGYVKLITRLTGAQVLVRGSQGGHAEASLPALLTAALPASGPVSVAGRRYTVSSFTRPGFAGEQLHAWILARA